MPRRSKKKTKKKGGTARKYRSASPMNLKRSKISKSKRSYLNRELKKMPSKRKLLKKQLNNSKNKRYSSNLKNQLSKLDARENKFRRQLPVSRSKRKVKSASAKAPSRSHRQSDLYLMRQKNLQRRPNETQKKYEMRMRRRRSARNVSRIARRPRSPVFDYEYF